MKSNSGCDPQSWAYKMATGTFAFVVIVSALAQVYQTTTGRGQASADLTDNMKSAMLVLSGMLAASKLGNHSPDNQDVTITNRKDDPVPVKEEKVK